MGSSTYVSGYTDHVLRYNRRTGACIDVFVGRGSGIHDVTPTRFLDRYETILYHPSTLRRQGAGSKRRTRVEPDVSTIAQDRE